ncbi:hypothetical protein B0H12DRAFT_721455 [Mycena haematopus]|nr:hypothetical protein B0H12DRAFT_721455 [Mycena haematopus]
MSCGRPRPSQGYTQMLGQGQQDRKTQEEEDNEEDVLNPEVAPNNGSKFSALCSRTPLTLRHALEHQCLSFVDPSSSSAHASSSSSRHLSVVRSALQFLVCSPSPFSASSWHSLNSSSSAAHPSSPASSSVPHESTPLNVPDGCALQPTTSSTHTSSSIARTSSRSPGPEY